MGKKLGYTEADCPVTQDCGTRLLRLPLSAMLTEEETMQVIENTYDVLRKMNGGH